MQGTFGLRLHIRNGRALDVRLAGGATRAAPTKARGNDDHTGSRPDFPHGGSKLTAYVTVSPISRRRDVLIAAALALVSFIVFNANMRSITAVDTYAARYLPLSIWQNQTLTLDPIAAEVAQGHVVVTVASEASDAFWIRKGVGDHLVSLYPVLTPLAVAPFYLPVVLYLDQTGWHPLRVDMAARVMEKLSASLLAAVTVALVYLLLRRRTEARTAILLATVFAFGTTTWVVSSQALWMHGLGALLVAATMLVLTGPSTPARSILAGLLCALIACNRQPDTILALGLGIYGLWWAGRRAPLFVAAGLVPAGILLTYNLAIVGNAFGAYALYGPEAIHTYLDRNPIDGFLGLLFSPARGLFVFSPFLLFLLFSARRLFRDPDANGLTVIVAAVVVLQVIAYGFGDWRQGVSWGPRWMTDALPILMWMLPPVVAGLAMAGRIVFGLACVASVAIQIVGAFWYTGISDAAIWADTGPEGTRAAWDIRNTAFISALRHPPAPADLLVPTSGSLDIVQVIARPDGTSLQVEGWALAGRETPAHVTIRVDGNDMAGTGEFFDRPDVVKALGVNAPSGWKLTIPLDDLDPGEHTVAVMMLVERESEQRLLRQATFMLDPDAARRTDAASRAVERIRAQQQAAGYWLTTHTSSRSFDAAGYEMNTYTQALLIDIAAPVAGKAGLEDALQRARGFLSAQIEDSGLVRYHGRPDSAIIGQLGCAITPDADDTALAWRIAPAARQELLRSALTTLDEYRRPDGLYRTWLAPQADYQCIDPGRDPNPADLGIQINVLLLLARVDEPAARTLCDAIRHRLDDDSLWVYYRLAPAIVALRRGDLEQAGCPLELPAGRLATTIAGQDTWMEVITLTQRLEGGDRQEATIDEAVSLLDLLAQTDFAALEQAPPLIYHNDLTATVSRYYWSPEVGLALWLRLHLAVEAARRI